jgi:hypothetical protein
MTLTILVVVIAVLLVPRLAQRFSRKRMEATG